LWARSLPSNNGVVTKIHALWYNTETDSRFPEPSAIFWEFLVRIIFFAGKGGVGKTSVAAATGIRAAEMGRRTVIMSLDVAHSLSDIFDLEKNLLDQNKCGFRNWTYRRKWKKTGGTSINIFQPF
jgi:hypothetical protein